MSRFPVKIISTQNSKLLQIRFFPTDICNYRCSYCFANLENKHRFPKDITTVIKNFRSLLDYYITHYHKTEFELTISGGGEPTLWPNIEQFCKEIKDTHNIKIILVSNGARNIQWWEQNSKFFDDVVLSCHHEYVNLDHYIAVADLLYERNVNVIAFSLMDSNNWDKCVDQVERMKTSKHPWFIEVKPIVGDAGKVMGIDTYSKEQLQYLNDTIKRLPESSWLLKRIRTITPFESIVLFNDDTTELASSQSIIVNKWNYFKNWNCNIALETLVIGPSGDVKISCGATAVNYLSFNIFKSDSINEFKITPIKCPFDACTCSTDTHATKSVSID